MGDHLNETENCLGGKNAGIERNTHNTLRLSARADELMPEACVAFAFRIAGVNALDIGEGGKNMLCKILEVRDRQTFIPVIAVDMNPIKNGQRFLLRRSGYACNGEPIILLARADGHGAAHYDPYNWKDRTMKTAHDHITKQWNRLLDGDVIDVEYILGETKTKKQSESRLTTVGG